MILLHNQDIPDFICLKADLRLQTSASYCCAGVHRGNTWLFTEADRLSASRCSVAEVGLTKRAEGKPLETDYIFPQLDAFGTRKPAG